MSRFLVKILSVFLLLVLSLVLSDGAMPAAAQGTGSISGRVINDLNGNGTADPGEPGVEGWRVVLTRLFSMNPGSVVVAEARTGQGGDYLFSGLPPGLYKIDLPCDGQPVAQWTGIFPDRRAGRAFPIGSPDAESIVGMNFLIGGLVDPLRTDGEITGRMVNDRDADGTADRGEPGLAGWSVTMIRESPPLVCLGKPLPRESFRLTTDSKGGFQAKGLVEGTYSIVDPMTTRPPTDAQTEVTHWAVTAPLTVFTIPGYGDTPVAVPSEVTLTSRKMKADVGDTLVALLDGRGSISGYAFRDLDGNQKLDENEPMVFPPMVGLQYASRLGPLWVYPAFPLVGVGTDGRYRFERISSAGKYIVSASVLRRLSSG